MALYSLARPFEMTIVPASMKDEQSFDSKGLERDLSLSGNVEDRFSPLLGQAAIPGDLELADCFIRMHGSEQLDSSPYEYQ